MLHFIQSIFSMHRAMRSCIVLYSEGNFPIMRTILSDVGEYEKQAMKIRKEVRRNYQGISAGAV